VFERDTDGDEDVFFDVDTLLLLSPDTVRATTEDP
jgi:hypothetical protein